MRFKVLMFAALIAAPTLAAAQQSTVDGFTPDQAAKAKSAVQAAGYTPGPVTMAQGGTLFVNATRGGQTYSVTVTPDGQTFASTANP